MGLFLRKNLSFKMSRLSLFSQFDFGSDSVSIVRFAKKKIEALIRSMKFLSPEVVLYLYKSTT